MLDRLRWLLDVYVGHRIIWDWLPNDVQAWWYEHICIPAGLWECRDLPDLTD